MRQQKESSKRNEPFVELKQLKPKLPDSDEEKDQKDGKHMALGKLGDDAPFPSFVAVSGRIMVAMLMATGRRGRVVLAECFVPIRTYRHPTQPKDQRTRHDRQEAMRNRQTSMYRGEHGPSEQQAC